MITLQQIEQMILAKLPGSRVDVQDMMGTGDHFEITVEAREFAGKSRMEQHKMIFEILKMETNDRIHAVQIKTKVLV